MSATIENKQIQIYRKPESCMICKLLKSFHVKLTPKGRNVTYHSFPRSLGLYNDWKKAITDKFPKAIFQHNAMVCSRHFPKSDFMNLNGRKVLKVPATPIVKEFYEYFCNETNGNQSVDIDAIGEQDLSTISQANGNASSEDLTEGTDKCEGGRPTTKCVICSNIKNLNVINNLRGKLTYYRFPEDGVYNFAWRTAILAEDPDLEIADDAVVCSLHFPKTAFKSVNTLKTDAIPKIVYLDDSVNEYTDEIIKQMKIRVQSKKLNTLASILKVKSSENTIVDDENDAESGFKFAVPKVPPPVQNELQCVICLNLQNTFLSPDEWKINTEKRIFHPFPLNRAMRTLWTKVILTKFADAQVMTSHVCSLHFLESDLIGDDKRSLAWHAVPVIPILDPGTEESVETEDDDISDFISPETIRFETVDLGPKNHEISSLNAVFESSKTCTFLFTKPTVKVIRLTSVSALEEAKTDFAIMSEFYRLVGQTEADKLMELNQKYIGGVDNQEVQITEICRLCLNQRNLYSIFEIMHSDSESLTIPEWVTKFRESVTISPDDQLPKKICMKCRIEILYAINLRKKARDSNKTLHNMFLNEKTTDDDVDDSLIEVMPMCRICLGDSELQPIEPMKEKIEIITDFELRLNNGLPNFICTFDQSKINTTIAFFEKVQIIDCIQRKVLLDKPNVNKLFPKLDDLLVDSIQSFVVPTVSIMPKIDSEPVSLPETYVEEAENPIEDPDLVKDYSENDLLEPIDEIKEIHDVVMEDLDSNKDLLETLQNSEGVDVEWADIFDENAENNLDEEIKDINLTEQEYQMMPRTTSFDTMLLELSKTVVVKKIYKCEVCDKVCATEDRLKRHKKYVHGKSFQCGRCARQCATAYTLKLHKLTNHFEAAELFPCMTCEQSFKHPFLLTDHEKYCVKVAPVKAKRKMPRKPTWACRNCDLFFCTRDSYELHHKSHNGRYECKKCSAVTTTRILALQHFTGCRMKGIKCEFCELRTFHRVTLTKHLNKEHPEFKPHGCTYCDKRFNLKKKLTVHIRKHTGERPYKCLLCNLFFIDGSRLSKHIKTRYHKRVLEQSEECGIEEYLDYENL